MIWHFFEIWLILLAAFAVGCGLGAAIYSLVAGSRFAERQGVLADAVGDRIDDVKARLGIEPVWRPEFRRADVLAARLLVSYHLAHQRPMMAAFLDALGIPHEDGLINDELETAVAPETLARGVDALRAAYPDADVRLYFETLLLQDPDTWGGLSAHIEGRD